MAHPPQFWNKIAEKYAAQPVGDEAAYQRKLATTAALLQPHMHVLEIGCGTGTTALFHAPNVKNYLAIDFSNEMIRIANDKAKAQNAKNLRFEVQSINALNAKEESFDAILGMSILHLLPDHQDVLAEVFRLLKPGGYFFSSTVCIGDGNPIIPFILPLMKAIGKAPYVGNFTSAGLAADIAQAGFVITEQWQPKKGASLFVVAQKP